MSMIRAVVGVGVGLFVLTAAYLALAPAYEAIVPVVAEDQAVQDAGLEGVPGLLQQAGLHYFILVFLGGLVALGLIHVLREELLVTRRF